MYTIPEHILIRVRTDDRADKAGVGCIGKAVIAWTSDYVVNDTPALKRKDVRTGCVGKQRRKRAIGVAEVARQSAELVDAPEGACDREGAEVVIPDALTVDSDVIPLRQFL